MSIVVVRRLVLVLSVVTAGFILVSMVAGWLAWTSIKTDLKAARDDGAAAKAAAQILGQQIESKGDTPVVDPDKLKGPPGDQGLPGLPGPSGAQGEDGTDGINGKNGADGAVGQPGQPGVDGETGKPGTPGEPGVPGSDGADGKNGENGKDGKDGADGAQGPPGPAGADGSVITEFTCTDTPEGVVLTLAYTVSGTGQVLTVPLVLDGLVADLACG